MTDRWIEDLRRELGVDAELDVDRLLDVARLAAHQVERKVAPLTTYLMGVAVGRGESGSFEDVCASVEEMISQRGPEGTG